MPDQPSIGTRTRRWALALILTAYVLPLLAPVPLMEDDEGLHAAIALDMVERGDWVVPRLLGQPFLDKPILYFWMEAASIAAFGPSELAVRLPGPLLGLAGAAATAWLARVLFGEGLAIWAALIYATMLLPYAVTLVPLHDLVMVPLVAVALGAFWRAHRASTGAQVVGWTLAAGLALGLSMLGKGLTGAGLTGVGMVTWMAWTRTWSRRLVLVGIAALALGIAVAWPWYAAMEAASPGYLRYFILERHLGGVAGQAQRHAGRPFWYYLPILVGGTWPWVVAALRRPLRQADFAERLVWSWLLADLVLLSVAGSKLPTYLLPAFPAVALLAARAVTTSEATSSVAPRWVRLLTAVVPSVSVALLLARWPALHVTALTSLTLLPILVAGAPWLLASARRFPSAEHLLLVTAAVLAAVGLAVRPLGAAALTARGLADTINRSGRMPRQLLIVDEGVGSFLFYLRPDLRHGLTHDRVLRVSRFSLGDQRRSDDVLVAIAANRLEEVRAVCDLPSVERLPVGTFQVVPLSAVHPRRH